MEIKIQEGIFICVYIQKRIKQRSGVDYASQDQLNIVGKSLGIPFESNGEVSNFKKVSRKVLDLGSKMCVQWNIKTMGWFGSGVLSASAFEPHCLNPYFTNGFFKSANSAARRWLFLSCFPPHIWGFIMKFCYLIIWLANPKPCLVRFRKKKGKNNLHWLIHVAGRAAE